MHRAARQDGDIQPRASRPAGWRGACWRALCWLVLAIGLAVPVAGSAADGGTDFTSFEVTHGDDGVFLNYNIDLELSRSVEDALSKAVPLFFVAEAEVFRSRFYWRDQRVGYAVRRWRVVFQPLTSTYRVTFDGGISQNYASRSEAFDAITRSVHWKIAEAPQIEDGSHYVEFKFSLDTAQLPRPMQIGIGGQADWNISVKRTQKIN